jgi:hypothetical protein
MAEQNFTTNLDNFGGIYVLRCPITQTIKYIGQTKNFKQRKNHHFCSNQHSIPMKKWVLNLKKENLHPIFEVIFICDDQKIKDKVEVALINKLKKDLVNVRNGGFKSQSYLTKYKSFFN